jgi:5-methyltetrahydropteroyltriglutamate--homocysteine methyltransferase
MRKSDERILTTHVGSIPRNAALRDLLVKQDRGEAVDARELERQMDAAVRMVVNRQREVGIDVGNDGEQPRVGFSTYVARRMRGFGGESKRPLSRDLIEFPDYAELLAFRRRAAARITKPPQAEAEISYDDLGEAAHECDLFAAATAAAPTPFVEGFMTAVSPGTVATILLNAHYDSHERYVMALAREMRKEYELIHARGFVLQLDCPDLAMESARFFQHQTVAQFVKTVELHIEAINQAIVNIPADRVRLHLCWGNYDGPHVHDVALEAILPAVLQARVGALSLPLANPRHQHEYKVIKRMGLPAAPVPARRDRHHDQLRRAPEVVADRIAQAVDAIGDRTRVLASTDCGFGTFAGSEMCAESVVWAKLRALAEGAALASRRLAG